MKLQYKNPYKEASRIWDRVVTSTGSDAEFWVSQYLSHISGIFE